MERIDVRQLGPGRTEYHWIEPARTLGLEDEPGFESPIAIDVGAQRVGARVLVSGTAKSRVRLECSRCLEPFERDLAAEFSVEYREGPAPERRVDTVRDEDADVGWFVHPFIDLTDDLRQVLLVASPVYPVCREECRGLCPVCGGNRNRAACDHKTEETPTRPFAGLGALLKKES